MEKQCHKGAVTAIYIDSNYMLTGGVGKAWNRDSITLIIEYFGHKGEVKEIRPDINKVNLVYSVGSDKYLFCYDLRLQKQVFVKGFSNGNLLTFDQFITPEYDLSGLLKSNWRTKLRYCYLGLLRDESNRNLLFSVNYRKNQDLQLRALLCYR
jgi:hypothetical protein